MNAFLQRWIDKNRESHQISLVHKRKELLGGEILFLVSCSEIVSATERAVYRATLVLHASNLPLGRGWSPHIWQIIEGARDITLSLIEAEDKVDTGRIWHQAIFSVPKHALWNEINERLFTAEIELIDLAVQEFDTVIPKSQDIATVPTYYPRRTPDASKLDVERSIASQFDLIRVCDPIRFPAFFELYGHKYKLTLEKIHDLSNQD
ncbi:MAG: formyltransferase family protein [Pseudomonadota bacterium]